MEVTAMRNEIKTTESRIEYVMTHNFDDIKVSRYMNDIRKYWGNCFFFNVDEERKDNACIACDQIASFFICGYEVYGNVVKDELHKLIDTKFKGLFTFEEIILLMVVFIYERLPLSDYDFREILSNYAKIDFNYEEVKQVYNSDSPLIEFCIIASYKLINKITRGI